MRAGLSQGEAGAADRGEYRQAAGAVGENLKGRIGFNRCDTNSQVTFCRVGSVCRPGRKGGPKGLQVQHLCDNRRCCNPAHLVAGTASENARHMIERRRNGKPRAMQLYSVQPI